MNVALDTYNKHFIEFQDLIRELRQFLFAYENTQGMEKEAYAMLIDAYKSKIVAKSLTLENDLNMLKVLID